jgi:hypothetical protein
MLGSADSEFRRQTMLQLQASLGNAAVRSIVGRTLRPLRQPDLQRQPAPDPKAPPGPLPGTGGTGPGTTTGGATTTGGTTTGTTPAPALSKPTALDRDGLKIPFTSAKGDRRLRSRLAR